MRERLEEEDERGRGGGKKKKEEGIGNPRGGERGDGEKED